MNNKSHKSWSKPKSRDFAKLKEPSFFAELLEIAQKEKYISVGKLSSEESGLRQRLRKLWVVNKISKTALNGAITALNDFGWLIEDRHNHGLFKLTKIGAEIADIASEDDKKFRRLLLTQIQKKFVIPGWFITRLIILNPEGEGEIILPAPLKGWKPESRSWSDFTWNKELTEQVMESARKSNKVIVNSFPIEEKKWLEAVKSEWENLSLLQPKKVPKLAKRATDTETKLEITTYTPRSRLSHAMRAATIKLLFDRKAPNEEKSDFSSKKSVLFPRSFTAWCPILDSLELLFYTDSHPSISGRLLFPCAVFSKSQKNKNYEPHEIKNPYGDQLYLHQPSWTDFRQLFINTLLESYKVIVKNVGAIYVSLLDVRDEVCRQLSLSNIIFDDFLERAYRESISQYVFVDKKSYSISLESDIREEQRSGYGLLRRPVYINNIPNSLIAISV